MHEAARMRVKAHIAAEVPQHLQEVVYKGVQARFPEIQLPPFGRIVTDCYRPPVMRASPPPFLEENVTTLMEMRLANRERALQVLVAHANNLAEAVAFLLALH
jgi:hypothetical protein